MSNITKKDKFLLLTIADYQVLKVDQLALLNDSGKGIVQRKIAKLFKNGFVNLFPRNSSVNFGRPENIILISERGVKLLQKENFIDRQVPIERFVTDKIKNIEHQLLVNWSRIHLRHISQKLPDLTVDFIPSSSSFFPLRNNGQPLVSEYFEIESHQINFIPDGVFYIKSEIQNKSLLFFLEVDMGTESLKSRSPNSNNILRKIKNYRAYFQFNKYKRYQKKWNTLFNGFRLLFLTNTTERKNKISDLVSLEKTNDFIWIADQYDMFEKGIGGKIWTQGGNTVVSKESIIGPTLSFDQRIIL